MTDPAVAGHEGSPHSVEPNVRAEAEKRNMYCTSYRHFSENVEEIERPIGPHFSQQFPNCPKSLVLQNISHFVSQICCGRPRGRYVGRGCHTRVLLTQRSAVWRARFGSGLHAKLASPFRAQAQNASTLHGILCKIKLGCSMYNKIR